MPKGRSVSLVLPNGTETAGRPVAEQEIKLHKVFSDI